MHKHNETKNVAVNEETMGKQVITLMMSAGKMRRILTLVSDIHDDQKGRRECLTVIEKSKREEKLLAETVQRLGRRYIQLLELTDLLYEAVRNPEK